MPNSYQAYTDFDLIALLKSDDFQAFETLYSRYFGELYNHAYQKLRDYSAAQAVVQSLFVHFWQNRHTIDAKTVLTTHFFAGIRYLVIAELRKKMTGTHNSDN